MPPVRSMPLKQPTRTERSHEENQERAYIAASRRSDRSLEARVESARRASEIHKKRTGRSLRVTEQDVMNEEMYEEEDDDLPWQYRRLGILGDLNVLDPEMQKKVQAQVAIQMERSRLLQEAVANMQGNSQFNGNSMFQSQPSPGFMNPGAMQSPQTPFPHQSFSQQMQSRPQSNYRQSPYPVQHPQHQAGRPNLHQRSVSIATPQDIAPAQRPSPYAQSMPNQAMFADNRRMSLPPQSLTPQPLQAHAGAPHMSSPTHSVAGMKREASSSHNSPSGRSSKSVKLERPSVSPSAGPQFPQQRHNTFAGPFGQGFGYNQQATDSPYGPLTPSIPIETQQLLGGPIWPGMSDAGYGSVMQTGTMQPPQQFYSYNPNAKARENKSTNEPRKSEGLDQTLMPTSLDTNIGWSASNGVYDTPTSTTSGGFNSAVTDPGYGVGYGYDKMFSMDPFQTLNSSGPNSGQVTPHDDFASFLESNMFADQSQAF